MTKVNIPCQIFEKYPSFNTGCWIIENTNNKTDFILINHQLYREGFTYQDYLTCPKIHCQSDAELDK